MGLACKVRSGRQTAEFATKSGQTYELNSHLEKK
jgi:hypothetical protein